MSDSLNRLMARGEWLLAEDKQRLEMQSDEAKRLGDEAFRKRCHRADAAFRQYDPEAEPLTWTAESKTRLVAPLDEGDCRDYSYASTVAVIGHGTVLLSHHVLVWDDLTGEMAYRQWGGGHEVVINDADHLARMVAGGTGNL